MSIEAIFKVIAYGVPALMVLGGIVLLIFGYPIGHTGMIMGGWALILIGVIIYLVEIFLEHGQSSF